MTDVTEQQSESLHRALIASMDSAQEPTAMTDELDKPAREALRIEGETRLAILPEEWNSTLSNATSFAAHLGLEAGMKLQRERDAVIAEGFMHGVSPQITARFGVDVGIYKQHNGACRVIAQSIRTQP